MFTVEKYSQNRKEGYEQLLKQARALLEDETSITANLANASALLNQFLPNINWVGFYEYEELSDQLVLGPFQGLPACVRIPIGKGVCGTAAKEQKTLVVEDVHQFPGHIACDAASQSEIVVPIVKDGQLFGVLDIDSPEKGRFDQTDQEWLEKFVDELNKHI
ncbi:GAF domain-containing protein [Fictibacillus enclensis]|uniref:GAF domain-containing protein n=1 Tax=Fictibacillus enclensis TaxID=1017270 RepID=A0A0V8J923_9BACL|nr:MULTISPECIES: GAF domain-containing protein [Fictibacillus]KSU83638.1 GAF domain-containing protein [Fictibacillus enclensis]MDM5339406.1 GAF domain-containing protein [Fictibacillus enclensis]RXZ02463.1 GAF domain-containing protein [Fictibacillus sp. S7]WHY70855.1 GAF domain-containing protein [Fictibacillus enclensis]SCC18813.1 GAF domain-containing protein [Fictibacillus enclensis]